MPISRRGARVQSEGPRMKTQLIVLVALLVFPLVALGSALLAERLMGPRPRRKGRARGKPRAARKKAQAAPKRDTPRG